MNVLIGGNGGVVVVSNRPLQGDRQVDRDTAAALTEFHHYMWATGQYHEKQGRPLSFKGVAD